MNELYQINDISFIYGVIVNGRPQPVKDAIKDSKPFQDFPNLCNIMLKCFNYNKERLNLPKVKSICEISFYGKNFCGIYFCDLRPYLQNIVPRR